MKVKLIKRENNEIVEEFGFFWWAVHISCTCESGLKLMNALTNLEITLEESVSIWNQKQKELYKTDNTPFYAVLSE